MRSLIAAALLALSSFSADAQAVNPPGSIDLLQPIVDDDGKPLKNETKRDTTVVVVRAFDEYKVGDRISDLATARRIAAGANAGSIALADQDCERCPPLTLGWVLSEALNTRACPQQQSARPETRPKECTDTEEKAEASVNEMTSRHNLAVEMTGSDLTSPPKPPLPSVVLRSKSLATVKDLVAVRFRERPAFVHRIWVMIDPTTEKAPEFGKE